MITRIGPKGVALIKEFEGFVGHPYQDSVGVWTIGYGHTEGVNRHTKPITKAQATALLKKDLDKRYAPYVAALKLPLHQGMFDALVSFVYNLGPGAINSTTGVGRELRAHHWNKAADHMLEWDKAGGQVLEGLHRRRVAERHLFLASL
jgi:lysozyme